MGGKERAMMEGDQRREEDDVVHMVVTPGHGYFTGKL